MRINSTIYDEQGMPRFALDRYPIGSYKNQKAAGIPINKEVAGTLNLYAKKIMNDMQFLALIAGGDGGVRMGKSTVAQGWGYYYTEKVNEILKKKGEKPISFTARNIAMSFESLKEKAFEVERYSCLILDESDDLSEHAMSKKMREINSFLQKNGQLNLFIILITDDYFKFPPTIAVTRSNFLAIVKYSHDDERGIYYERGYYDLYDAKDKRILYYKGKKDFRNIHCHKPTLKDVYFHGDYLVDEKEYLEEKRKDLERFRDGKKDVMKISNELFGFFIKKFYNYFKDRITMEELADCFGTSKRTLYRRIEMIDDLPNDSAIYNNNTLIEKKINPEQPGTKPEIINNMEEEELD